MNSEIKVSFHSFGLNFCQRDSRDARAIAVVVAGFVLFKPIRFFKNKEQKGEFLSLKKNILSLVSA